MWKSSQGFYIGLQPKKISFWEDLKTERLKACRGDSIFSSAADEREEEEVLYDRHR